MEEKKCNTDENEAKQIVAGIIKEKPENLLLKDKWWRTGTRSSTERFGNKNDDEKSYLLKIVPSEYVEDVWIEIGASKAFQNHEDTKDIFCEFMGYEHSNEKRCHYLVFNTEKGYPLDKRFKNSKDIIVAELFDSMMVCGKLHNNALKYKWEIEKEIRKVSGGRAVEHLEKLSEKQYARRFERYVNQKHNLSKKEAESLEGIFSEFAEEFLMDNDLKALIQHDGYPWHSTQTKLIDKGDLKIGCSSFHLGNLYGHPSIFNKLKDVKNSISEIAKQYSLQIMMNPSKSEEVEKGMLLGAMYGNYKLTYGDFFNEEEKHTLRKTSAVQAWILSKKEPQFKRMYKILRDNT